jgi:hypothetical protein
MTVGRILKPLREFDILCPGPADSRAATLTALRGVRLLLLVSTKREARAP